MWDKYGESGAMREGIFASAIIYVFLWTGEEIA